MDREADRGLAVLRMHRSGPFWVASLGSSDSLGEGVSAFLSSTSVAWPFSGGGEAVDRETDGVSAVYPVASVSRFVFFRPPIGSLGERAEAIGA